MTSLHPMLSIGTQLTEHVRRHLGARRRDAADARRSSSCAKCGSPIRRARSHAFPHQFSGGMRQRIAIAVALACRPRLLVADEPTTALDVTVQAGIIRLLDRLRRESGLTIVLITHDLGVLSAIADRVAVFYAGRVVEAGSRADVLGTPAPPVHARAARTRCRTRRRPAQPLVAIPGAPPAPRHVPPGCAFHPRCRYARTVLRRGGPAARPGGRARARVPRRPPAPASVGVSALELTRRRRRVRAPRASRRSARSPARASRSSAARSSASSASRAAASRRSRERPSGWSRRSAGTVRFEGREVRPLTRGARPRELARLQMVFQNPFSSLNPRRRVGEQIGDALASSVSRRARQRAARVAAAARAGRPPGRRGARLPARVLRRSAAAHRDRAGARREPVGHRPRRAAGLARRLGAGADREPPRRSSRASSTSASC